MPSQGRARLAKANMSGRPAVGPPSTVQASRGPSARVGTAAQRGSGRRASAQRNPRQQNSGQRRAQGRPPARQRKGNRTANSNRPSAAAVPAKRKSRGLGSFFTADNIQESLKQVNNLRSLVKNGLGYLQQANEVLETLSSASNSLRETGVLDKLIKGRGKNLTTEDFTNILVALMNSPAGSRMFKGKNSDTAGDQGETQGAAVEPRQNDSSAAQQPTRPQQGPQQGLRPGPQQQAQQQQAPQQQQQRQPVQQQFGYPQPLPPGQQGMSGPFQQPPGNSQQLPYPPSSRQPLQYPEQPQ